MSEDQIRAKAKGGDFNALVQVKYGNLVSLNWKGGPGGEIQLN